MKKSFTVIRSDIHPRKFMRVKAFPVECDHPIPASRKSMLVRQGVGAILRQLIRGKNFKLELYTSQLEQDLESAVRFTKRKIMFAYALKAPVYSHYVGETREIVLPNRFYGGFCTRRAQVTFTQPKGQGSQLYIWIRQSYLRHLCKSYESIRPVCDFIRSAAEGHYELPLCIISQDVLRVLVAIKQCNQTGNKLKVAVKGFIVELLEIYQKQLQEHVPMVNKTNEEKVLMLMEYIQEHFLEPGIEHLQAHAERYFMHMKTLTRVFKAQYGKTVKKVVTSLRMNHAEVLISNEHLSIKEAAACIGYPDPYTFSKAFKKDKGYPPKDLLR